MKAGMLPPQAPALCTAEPSSRAGCRCKVKSAPENQKLTKQGLGKGPVPRRRRQVQRREGGGAGRSGDRPGVALPAAPGSQDLRGGMGQGWGAWADQSQGWKDGSEWKHHTLHTDSFLTGALGKHAGAVAGRAYNPLPGKAGYCYHTCSTGALRLAAARCSSGELGGHSASIAHTASAGDLQTQGKRTKAKV